MHSPITKEDNSFKGHLLLKISHDKCCMICQLCLESFSIVFLWHFMTSLNDTLQRFCISEYISSYYEPGIGVTEQDNYCQRRKVYHLKDFCVLFLPTYSPVFS